MIWLAVFFLNSTTVSAQTLCDRSKEEIARAQPALEAALTSAGKLFQLEQSKAFRAPSDQYQAVDVAAVSVLETYARSPQISLEDGVAAVTAVEERLRCSSQPEGIRRYLELIVKRMRERLEEIATVKIPINIPDLQAAQAEVICRSIETEIKTVEARLQLAKLTRQVLASDEKWRTSLSKLREEICSKNPQPATNGPIRP